MLIRRLQQDASWLGPPPQDLSRRVALEELLAKTAYSGKGQGSVVEIEVDAVALPPIGFCPATISEIGGDRGRDIIERLETKILPMETYKENLQKCELKEPLLGSKTAQESQDICEAP